MTIGEPVVVAQAPPGMDRARAGWGRWQFPMISRLCDGQLQVRFSIEPDSEESRGMPIACAQASASDGPWRMNEPAAGHEVEEGILLPNGDRLKQVELKSRNAAELDLPASRCDFVCSYGYPRSLYRAVDLPQELAGWRFSRQSAGSCGWTEEAGTMGIPDELRDVTAESARSAEPGSDEARQVREGVLPLPSLRGPMRVAPDQSLWAATYQFRMFGQTPLYAPMFLRSTDAGHTWCLLSEIRYQGDERTDPHAAKRDGFTEPDYNFRPDGSIICLMRTMDGNGHGPLYVARSADQGRSWSRPAVFDRFGKMPQLLTLANGVTLAVYGASGGPGYLAVRATRDPSGQAWGEPVRVPVSPVAPGAWDTCGHTEVVPLDDHSALMVYSDFNFPDAEQNKRKTILVRRIRAEV